MDNKYDDLIKRLREEASEWCSNCCYRCGDNVCGAPDDRKKDCNIASKLQAADAIEELQKRVPKRPHGRLIDTDAVILEDGPYDYDEWCKWALEQYQDAPTVIEAEE